MSKRVYNIASRRVGERRRPGEIQGWMALVKGFGSPHGLRPFWFSQWAKETFSKTKGKAFGKFHREWSGWVLVAVKPIRLVKVELGPNEPINEDTMCELPIGRRWRFRELGE